MSREGSRLSRLGVLAPAALSACMDASVLAVPAAGAIVSTVLKELSKAFMLKKWFHGSMSAKEAEHLMMEKGKNGSFLVRESKSHPGEYVLSVRVRGRVSHVKIKKQDNKYDVGSGEKFEDLVGLIEHFRSYPMTETSGDVLRLLQPVSGTCTRGHDVSHKLHPVEDIDLLDVSDKYSFDGEFRSLQMSHNPNMYTTNEGFKPENRCKNRYGNIIPYDQTRVVLRRKDDRHGNEYINANYIRSSGHFDSTSSVESSNESLDSVHSLIIRNERKKIITPLVSKSLSDEALKEVKRCLKLDKMNGNLTVSKGKNKTYIASQGCLPNTKDDFWKMLWQEDVRVIVMLSNEYERGKKKCECYWPQTCKEEVYDLITIKNIGEHHYEDYVIRELLATDEKNNTRTIYHYQFTAWPDQGVPAEPDGVLAFIRDIDIRITSIMLNKQRPEQNVLCVHCSAGVGRTGTFIVLDMLINKIEKTGSISEIDVYNTVQLVRTQRDGMVQNESQYKFIYTAIRHYTDYTDRGFSRHR